MTFHLKRNVKRGVSVLIDTPLFFIIYASVSAPAIVRPVAFY